MACSEMIDMYLCSHNAVVLTAGAFGQGSGTIWLDEVNCQGNESSLLGCQTSLPGNTDCTHAEDVGVICTDGQFPIGVSNQIILGATEFVFCSAFFLR